VDLGILGGERGNVQTEGGDRVSTISLLGCNTSVALAMGPTEEEGMTLPVEYIISFNTGNHKTMISR